MKSWEMLSILAAKEPNFQRDPSEYIIELALGMSTIEAKPPPRVTVTWVDVSWIKFTVDNNC